MKKAILGLFVSVSLTGVASAQDAPPPPCGPKGDLPASLSTNVAADSRCFEIRMYTANTMRNGGGDYALAIDELHQRFREEEVAIFVKHGAEFIAAPLLAHLPEGGTMIATDVASPFLTPFKLAILAAVFLAMPVILHQAWGFIAPGLYLREKHFAIPLLVSSIALFYLGTAFAYYLVFPLVFGFFASVNMEFVTWMTDISPYLDFIVKMFLAFGLAFEIPIATVLLVMTGFASPESMAEKRLYVLVGCFFLGMLLTPPDVISQVLLAIPMWALFELGIFLSRFATRGREES